jgi:hypothetical protein
VVRDLLQKGDEPQNRKQAGEKLNEISRWTIADDAHDAAHGAATPASMAAGKRVAVRDHSARCRRILDRDR